MCQLHGGCCVLLLCRATEYRSARSLEAQNNFPRQAGRRERSERGPPLVLARLILLQRAPGCLRNVLQSIMTPIGSARPWGGGSAVDGTRLAGSILRLQIICNHLPLSYSCSDGPAPRSWKSCCLVVLQEDESLPGTSTTRLNKRDSLSTKTSVHWNRTSITSVHWNRTSINICALSSVRSFTFVTQKRNKRVSQWPSLSVAAQR